MVIKKLIMLAIKLILIAGFTGPLIMNVFKVFVVFCRSPLLIFSLWGLYFLGFIFNLIAGFVPYGIMVGLVEFFLLRIFESRLSERKIDYILAGISGVGAFFAQASLIRNMGYPEGSPFADIFSPHGYATFKIPENIIPIASNLSQMIFSLVCGACLYLLMKRIFIRANRKSSAKGSASAQQGYVTTS